MSVNWNYIVKYCPTCKEKTKSVFNKLNGKYLCGKCSNVFEIEWKTKEPKLFEYDSKNKIVDVFVRQDPYCPFPFHEEDWYHQGFFLEEFIIRLNCFFQNNNLDYRVREYESIH